MPRLIDADAIPYRDYLGDDEPRVYRSQIEAMPTIDPVKHAWWVDFRAHDKDWLRDDGKTVFMECSECHEKLCRNLMLSVNYCPSCGAKMDKEETV